MRDLDPYTQALLDNYCQETVADEDALARNWRGITSRVPQASKTPPRARMRWAVLGVALAVAALLVVALGVPTLFVESAGSRRLDEAPNVAPEADPPRRVLGRSGGRDMSQGRGEGVSPAPQPARPAPKPPLLPHSVTPPQRVKTTKVIRDPPRLGTRVQTPSRGTPSRASQQVRDRLGEETRLMEKARSALVGGRHEALLKFLSAHASRFPDGVMIQERMGWRIIALCRLGRPYRGELSAFRARFDDSVLARKIQQRCSEQSM